MTIAVIAWLAHALYAGQIPVPTKQPRRPSTDFLPTHNFKPEQVLPTLRQYHDAVQLYRQGRQKEAASAVTGLPRAQVEFIMATLRSVRRGKTVRLSENLSSPLPSSMRSDDAPFKWTRLDLAAAGLLQGDITVAKVDKADFEDELRLTLSMLPIADLPGANSGEPTGTWTRDWLRGAGNVMLASKAWGPLRILLKYADLLVPQDGPLLLVRGTLDELQSESAAPRIALTYAEGPAVTRRVRDSLRDDGIDALTQAVKLMSDSPEASVRLAHLRLDMRQPDRAALLLDRVLTSDSGDWWYFAALMRGDVYDRQGDAASAERLYRQVIARFPQAQSPYLSLALLQYASGRRDEAVMTFDRMYARPTAGDADDPWWNYPSRMGAPALAALDQLRQAVQQ